MNKSFNYEVNKILKNAETEMLELRHPYVGTEHLLLSLLKDKNIGLICKKYALTYENFRMELINIVGSSSKKSEVILYTPLLKMVIDSALHKAIDDNQELSARYLMEALITSDDGIALRILMGMNIDLEALYKDLSMKVASSLMEIGVDLSTKDNNMLIGREKEINSLIEILLRKNKNNPILIGECGVGKSAIVYELARRIKEGKVPKKLLDKKIIGVDMASMLSNTKYRGEFETRLNTIIKEVMENKNIILFIDEIHTIVKTGGGDGSIDAANILKPYLAYDDIKVIGATTINEYEKYIVKDKALMRRFEKVIVTEPTLEETENILKGVKQIYEDHHGVNITMENIHDIVECTNKYIYTNHNPDKSLDILDYVSSRVVLKEREQEKSAQDYLREHHYREALKARQKEHKNKLKITKEDILSVIESVTNIKIYDKNSYKKVISVLDERVIGQNLEPLKQILKKKLVNDKVIGILFKGEEHTGKSFTAKVIAEALGYNYLELNMQEYASSTSINRLMGSDPGYVGYEDESIFDKIKYNPYSLLVLKNIDAASSRIRALFKSIIEQGYIKDNKGEIINFNNAIIIMTSDVADRQIGYNARKDNEIEENVVKFERISKKDVKKYLESLKLDKTAIAKLPEYLNFKEINQALEESRYAEINKTL